jgi:hypothetical protein
MRQGILLLAMNAAGFSPCKKTFTCICTMPGTSGLKTSHTEVKASNTTEAQNECYNLVPLNYGGGCLLQ